MLILGIDDSGRGPLIGPMVLAGVLIEKKQELKLKKLGVKDSKLLSPKRREFLATEIKKIAKDYEIIKIFPSEIDKRSEIGINLNKIEAIKMAHLINLITSRNKFKEIKIVVDCPSTNIQKWSCYFKKFIEKPDGMLFCIDHKADRNNVACSAASIIAKVERDEEIKKLKEELNYDFGSGYPSDNITISFIKKNFDKLKGSAIIRESWQTWKNLQEEKRQKKLDEFS